MKITQRNNIINEMKKRANGHFTQEDIEFLVKLYESTIVDFVAENNKVQMLGFLTIEPIIQHSRIGRNIHTGEYYDVPERPGLKFKPGSKLKAATKKMDASEIKDKSTREKSKNLQSKKSNRMADRLNDKMDWQDHAAEKLNKDK